MILMSIIVHFKKMHAKTERKLRREYLNTVMCNTPVIIWIKKLNSVIYKMLFYVKIYESYKLSKNSPVFGSSCICNNLGTGKQFTITMQ